MPLPSCLSVTACRDRYYRGAFAMAGLRPHTATLADGTTVDLWAPSRPSASRPKLVLIHGFGANSRWQWGPHLRVLLRAGFDLYVPDLLFFGGSRTPLPDRSESFQAGAVMAALRSVGAVRFALVGVSYGGFVGYRMAAMFPDAVEKAVLCCAGVCLEERDLAAGLFVVSDVKEAASILLPQSPDRLRTLVRLSFCTPPPVMPSCFLADYIHVMCTNFVQEKTELLETLINERKLSDLPKITQPILIVWGEQDQIFPLELGHRLRRHLEENSELVVIKNAGHAVNIEKAKEFCQYVIEFLCDFQVKKNFKYKASKWRVNYKLSGFGLTRMASKLPLLSGEDGKNNLAA